MSEWQILYGHWLEARQKFYHIFPDAPFVELYGEGGWAGPVYELHARECEPGEETDAAYWAFQNTGEDDWDLIQPDEDMFRIQFTYGVEVEAEAGKGRMLRLIVEKVGLWEGQSKEGDSG